MPDSLHNLAEMVTRERCAPVLAHVAFSISHSTFVTASRRITTDVYFGTWRKYIVKKGRAHSAGSSNSCWKNSENFHRERASEGPVYLPAASNTFDSETLLGLFSSNVYSRSSSLPPAPSYLPEISARCRVLFGYENSSGAGGGWEGGGGRGRERPL
jgi:hypothetical protein